MASKNTISVISVLVLSVFILKLECRVFQEALAIYEISEIDHPEGVAQQEDFGVNGIISLQDSARMEVDADALLSIQNGASLRAVDTVQDGIKAAIDLVAASSDAADKSYAFAKNISFNNTDGAIREIAIGLKSARQSLLYSTVPIYYSFQGAGDLSGGESKIWVKQGLKIVEYGGKYVMQSLKAGEALAINGFKLNSTVVSKGIDEAQEITSTGYKAAFMSLVLAGKSVFKGMSNTGRSDKQNCNIDINTNAKNAQANSAENAVILSSEQAVSLNPNATNKIKEAFICGIRTLASGETSGLTAISIATELASKEPEIADSVFKIGMKILKKAIIAAGNKTCQGLDDASHILGYQDANNKIAYQIFKIQKSVTAALDSLDLVKKLPSIGMKISGDVVEEGLKSVEKYVSAIISQFYSLSLTIADESFHN